MADLASFSLSDRRAAPHSRAHQYRLTAVSAVIQSAARLERGRTLNNVRGGGSRAGQGRAGQGRAGQGRAGQGRAGQGRAGQGRAVQGRGRAGEGRAGQGRAGQGRGGEGRGGDCPHFPQTRTFVTAEPSRPPAKRVTG